MNFLYGLGPVIEAWATGKSLKVRTNDEWKDITPDNLKARVGDEWVSLREAIRRLDERNLNV